MPGIMGVQASDDKPLEIIMKRAATVTGQVLHVDGSPVISARVRLVPKRGGQAFGGLGPDLVVTVAVVASGDGQHDHDDEDDHRDGAEWTPSSELSTHVGFFDLGHVIPPV